MYQSENRRRLGGKVKFLVNHGEPRRWLVWDSYQNVEKVIETATIDLQSLTGVPIDEPTRSDISGFAWLSLLTHDGYGDPNSSKK